MNALPKSQLDALTPEQQKTVAATTLTLLHRRDRLLQDARRHRSADWIPVLASLGLYGIFMVQILKINPSADRFLPFALALVVFVLVQFHAKSINRRLDALLELIETDLLRAENHDQVPQCQPL